MGLTNFQKQLTHNRKGTIMKQLLISGTFLTILGLLLPMMALAEKATNPLKITLTSSQDSYALGDWVEVKFNLHNTGQADLNLVKPVVDVHSVSFEITCEYLKSRPEEPRRYFTFVHTGYTPSVSESNKGRLEKIVLGSGKEYSCTFKIPALLIGKMKVLASYQGWMQEVKSNPIEVEIKPAVNVKTDAQELIAVIDTNYGKIICKFYPETAPNTVLNFIKLAQEGFYTNHIFHRVIKGFMIQGGCPKRNGTGGPGYSIKAEFNQQKHLVGTLSMARSQHNDSAGSQFFICLVPTPQLDNKYTVFGQVSNGIEVVKEIGEVKTTGRGNPADKPLADVVIKQITIEPRALVQKDKD